jgi:hypothetical protein
VDGTASWLDNTVNWGGVRYDNVNADHTYMHAHFYPTSDGTTLAPDTLLWSPPVCAMKTMASGSLNGSFYVPSVITQHLLKVEVLFDNTYLTGDQSGGVSPYAAIGVYPDGIVNMMDVGKIARAWTSVEGGPQWNYMADVVPERKVDMKDIATAARNFGQVGSYMTGLSGVTVLFDTGQNIPIDICGFVTIPLGATSFTVKRNGTPIGAMIIFW